MNQSEIQKILDQQAYESKRGGPPEDFPQLPDIPGERYVDPEFNRLEIERMWHKTWVYAIHADEVPEVGSYVQWDRLGEPLFFIRGEDQTVRCIVIHEPAGTAASTRFQAYLVSGMVWKPNKIYMFF